jgi:hypothetical protein
MPDEAPVTSAHWPFQSGESRSILVCFMGEPL